jgi:hypothetical protein
MSVLRAVLPDRYSPLQRNGNGIQSIYLTELSQDFAEVLCGLIGEEARSLITVAGTNASIENGRIAGGDDLDVWERTLEEQVETDASIKETDREAIVRARRGQGLFKQRVLQIETHCRITGVDNLSHLLAIRHQPAAPLIPFFRRPTSTSPLEFAFRPGASNCNPCSPRTRSEIDSYPKCWVIGVSTPFVERDKLNLRPPRTYLPSMRADRVSLGGRLLRLPSTTMAYRMGREAKYIVYRHQIELRGENS